MLLEDFPSKKTFAYFRGQINKGELVNCTKSKQWIVAYSSPPIFVNCQMDQLKIVKFAYLPYLLAVENLTSRYNLFINNQNHLIKCVLLNVGDEIDLILEQHVIPSAAIVRYKGNLPRKLGIFFGVELLVS